ncbi:ROK family transcriptional regulator [Microbacterium sp. YMB-B2]|uniref:ROK family transcriptional regulator n=1 Tax=Microbacterium tenebrionis TaxID=2830665 RepID=A0A9X1LMW6_9MICO|nr:ROK family transcriptional regulator [Microbacterium tenebrionis]MCC2028867.1 ROK family transcriptional regulator [Microbacterium tenebrionis]
MTPRQKEPSHEGRVTGPGAGEMFQLFRNGQPRTKSELASLTGLSRTTVSARIDALLAAGLLVYGGDAASTGGRPPAQVMFNPAAGSVVAVEVGATHATISMVDLGGSILEQHSRPIDIAAGPQAVLDVLLAEVAQTRRSPVSPSPVLGFGIGLPGPVEHSTGRPMSPPIMPGWDGYDVPAYFRQYLDVPVLVDNEVNLLALGEHAANWSATDDLVFVKVATGIGAGLVLGGELQRGGRGAAGDLGQVRVSTRSSFDGSSGTGLTLESVASGTGIAADLRQRGFDVRDAAGVVALARAGEHAAIDAIRQAGRELGEVLSNVVALLNPSVIVLGGSIAGAGDHLLAGVREVIYQRCVPFSSQHLSVVSVAPGASPGVKGAALMVTHQLLSVEGVDLLVATGTLGKAAAAPLELPARGRSASRRSA